MILFFTPCPDSFRYREIILPYSTYTPLLKVRCLVIILLCHKFDQASRPSNLGTIWTG